MYERMYVSCTYVYMRVHTHTHIYIYSFIYLLIDYPPNFYYVEMTEFDRRPDLGWASVTGVEGSDLLRLLSISLRNPGITF